MKQDFSFAYYTDLCPSSDDIINTIDTFAAISGRKINYMVLIEDALKETKGRYDRNKLSLAIDRASKEHIFSVHAYEKLRGRDNRFPVCFVNFSRLSISEPPQYAIQFILEEGFYRNPRKIFEDISDPVSRQGLFRSGFAHFAPNKNLDFNYDMLRMSYVEKPTEAYDNVRGNIGDFRDNPSSFLPVSKGKKLRSIGVWTYFSLDTWFNISSAIDTDTFAEIEVEVTNLPGGGVLLYAPKMSQREKVFCMMKGQNLTYDELLIDLSEYKPINTFQIP